MNNGTFTVAYFLAVCCLVQFCSSTLGGTVPFELLFVAVHFRSPNDNSDFPSPLLVTDLACIRAGSPDLTALVTFFLAETPHLNSSANHNSHGLVSPNVASFTCCVCLCVCVFFPFSFKVTVLNDASAAASAEFAGRGSQETIAVLSEHTPSFIGRIGSSSQDLFCFFVRSAV